MGTVEQEEPVMLSPSKAQGLEVLWGVAGLSPFEKHKKLESGVLGRSRGNGQTH